MLSFVNFFPISAQAAEPYVSRLRGVPKGGMPSMEHPVFTLDPHSTAGCARVIGATTRFDGDWQRCVNRRAVDDFSRSAGLRTETKDNG